MYESFYQINKKPFQLTPDNQFFYPSAGHSRALSFLQYGLMQEEGFIVITGNVGAGKTTVIHTLLRELESTIKVIHIVNTLLDSNDLLKMIIEALDGDLSTQEMTLIKQVERLAEKRMASGERLLLLIDEAQNLKSEAVEELRMLSNLLYQGRPMMQIFLIGQPEFRELLLSKYFEQLRQRITASYHLTLLNLEETITYIQYRLDQVGSELIVITKEAFNKIYLYTEGTPRRINQLCDRLLLYGFLNETYRFDVDSVKAVAFEIVNEWGDAVSSEIWEKLSEDESDQFLITHLLPNAQKKDSQEKELKDSPSTTHLSSDRLYEMTSRIELALLTIEKKISGLQRSQTRNMKLIEKAIDRLSDNTKKDSN